MDAREERLAQNEAIFREINERVREIASGHGVDTHVYSFFCECSNSDCTLQLDLTLPAYEEVRAHGARFVVHPGHELPDIEVVVRRTSGWNVIEKLGGAAVLAEEQDPRNEG